MSATGSVISAVLTVEGHDEDTDGNNPGDSTVRLTKLCHQVLEEDAEALDGAISKNLHQKEGHGHRPAPAAVRGLWVHIGPQETWPLGSTQCHDCRE